MRLDCLLFFSVLLWLLLPPAFGDFRLVLNALSGLKTRWPIHPPPKKKLRSGPLKSLNPPQYIHAVILTPATPPLPSPPRSRLKKTIAVNAHVLWLNSAWGQSNLFLKRQRRSKGEWGTVYKQFFLGGGGIKRASSFFSQFSGLFDGKPASRRVYPPPLPPAKVMTGAAVFCSRCYATPVQTLPLFLLINCVHARVCVCVRARVCIHSSRRLCRFNLKCWWCEQGARQEKIIINIIIIIIIMRNKRMHS